MRTERQRLALRGAGASFSVNLIAAVSHTLGGEDAPAPLLVLGMMALLWAPSMALMGRRPRAGRIAVTVITAQAAFHTAYAALGFPTGATHEGAHAAHAGHGGHGMLDADALAGGPLVEVGAAMVAAHVVAAVVTFLVLMFGERTIRRILEWTVASLRARLAVPVQRILPRPGAVAAAVLAPRADRPFTPAGPRGPPLPSC